MTPTNTQTHSSSKPNLLARAAWRISTLILLLILLGCFAPVIVYESAVQLPLSPLFTYILTLIALTFTAQVTELFFEATDAVFLAVDAVLTVAWLAAFGIFAKAYVSDARETAEEKLKGVGRARIVAGTWVLLVVTLWFAVWVVWGCVERAMARRRGTKKEGGEEEYALE